MQGLVCGFANGDPSAIQSRRVGGPFALSEGRLSFFSAAGSTGDTASVPSTAAMEQTTTWSIAFKIKTDRIQANAAFVAQWHYGTGKSRFLINDNNGAIGGVSVYIGDGATNDLSRVAKTPTGTVPNGTETEVCVVYDGTQSTDATRLKMYARAIGGTWALVSWLSIGTIPATMPAPAEPLTLGVMPGFAPRFDGLLWDLRMWSAPVTPSGTADISLTSCVARWRFRSGAGFASTDEIGANTLTLTSTFGGVHRPGWVVDGWQAVTGSSKVLCFGDSKTAGVPYVGAWREECANRLAARWRKSVDFVGRNVDAAGLAAFAGNAQHSSVGGATLGGLTTWAATDVPLYTPDLVILEGGTNDITGGSTAAVTRDAMGTLIDAVLAGSSTCKVLLMTDPIINNAFTATQATYNGLLPALVAAKGARVSLVDAFAVTRTDMLADALHPSERGYRRIAEVIADAVAGLV